MGIQPIRKVVAPEIPDKLYFRIGDVARLCEVPAYVLRFWETEFPQLKPTKGGTGQRLYRKRDVEMALRIKSLLYDQRYTIPGARQVFKDEAKARETAAAGISLPVPVPGEGFAQEREQKPENAPKITSMAAKTQVAASPVASTSASTSEGGLDLRRQLQLSALRDDMQALLTLLQAPPAAAGEPKPLRPRLMLEPRPVAARAEAPRPEMLRLVRDAAREAVSSGQREFEVGSLFPGE